MNPPSVTFIYAQGCGACHAAMPEFKKLAMSLPKWRFNMMDVDKPGVNLDFPVNYTPTLHFRIGSKRYVTDPNVLKRPFTEANMRLWLEAAVAKWRVEGSPK
jgi:thiol-disulfide isomerase/thioredoxin